jgi:hypothetical protein
MRKTIIKSIKFPRRRIRTRDPKEIGTPSDEESIAAFQKALEALAKAERSARADDRIRLD